MGEHVVVGLMTAPDRETADRIADQLVQERLIACANLSVDISSVYRWQGAVERAAEILVIMKTTVAQAERVIERVRELHPYDVPEVIFLPVTTGYDAYMEWVRASVLPQDTFDAAKKNES